jgi:hypothetical protein
MHSPEPFGSVPRRSPKMRSISFMLVAFLAAFLGVARPVTARIVPQSTTSVVQESEGADDDDSDDEEEEDGGGW